MTPPSPPPPTPPAAASELSLPQVLQRLVLAQVALHAAMAGQRLAAPLQALSLGHTAWEAGVLLALFAALPVVTAMASGRLADRHGYHLPQRVAVACTVAGALCALLACALDGWPQFALAAVGAGLAGVGTNVGLIAMQRTGGRLGQDGPQRLQVFSWLGLAPSLANVVGPVSAGLLIDAGGHALAYAVMAVLPLASLWAARRVPAAVGAPLVAAGAASPRGRGLGQGLGLDLLQVPGLRRLFVVNWLLSASWDVHAFAVPLLGHARGYSASTIGLVLGCFTTSVTAVRLLIPLLAHRLDEVRTLTVAMLCTASIFAVYPWAPSPWAMGACAVLLGFTLGSVQPMLMSTLHQLTPGPRQGEAIAFRSMALNLSSCLMPLAFGAVSATVGALGPALLFWAMGGSVGAGSLLNRGLQRARQASVTGGGPD